MIRTKTLYRSALAASLTLPCCQDPAEADLDRCMEYETKKEWSAAFTACEQATQKSLTSTAGRLAFGKLSLLREKVAAIEALNRAQAEATRREEARLEEHRQRDAAFERAQAQSKEEQPTTKKTLRQIAREGRAMLATCAPPRIRELSRVCIEDLRRSHAALDRLKADLGTARDEGGEGGIQLFMALGFAKNCCNCSEDGARYCKDAESLLDDAEARMNRR